MGWVFLGEVDKEGRGIGKARSRGRGTSEKARALAVCEKNTQHLHLKPPERRGIPAPDRKLRVPHMLRQFRGSQKEDQKGPQRYKAETAAHTN